MDSIKEANINSKWQMIENAIHIHRTDLEQGSHELLILWIEKKLQEIRNEKQTS